MKLVTKAQAKKLAANGSNPDQDHAPVVKLFTAWGSATWLLSETHPDNADLAFGLCDLGFGTAELGWVYLSELASITGPMGLKVERSTYFTSSQPMSGYSADAREAGYIVA
jgi:hypothetical protein|tara:strand:+ start:479 stop:811 length:333 start_codon:yes stop_codon:yes gene_type:complete